MKFRDQVFEFYDAEGKKATFSEVFSAKAAEGSRRPFALSGMGEIREALMITAEWYEATCPVIVILEKKPTAPGVFRDGNGKPSEYTREIAMPVAVKEGERKFSWKEQQYLEQEFAIHMSPVLMHKEDYYPAAGDVFKWRDLWRQVTAVKVDPTDYFHNTGFPLHIKVESTLWTPEIKLDGTVPCGPKIVTKSSVADGDRAPESTDPGATSEGDGASSSSDVAQGPGLAEQEVGDVGFTCDCPVKVPQCYVKQCNYHTSRSESGEECGC